MAAKISIHAPRTGRDSMAAPTTPPTYSFQSTRPVRDATEVVGHVPPFDEISIHAPRTGRDWPARPARWHRDNFNPRAPYGTRLVGDTHPNLVPQFQSTRPVRDATALPATRKIFAKFQSTRPVRDATALANLIWVLLADFNPRAPYGTRPRCRPPARFSRNFNPRAPYGTRRAELRKTGDKKIFQSTRPVRDATKWPVSFSTGSKFQSTRPVRDATRPTDKAIAGALFQSTRPVRDATLALEVSRNTCQISIHAPRTGRDRKELDATKTVAISIHAPRTGRDTSITNINLTLPISIHAPRTGRD